MTYGLLNYVGVFTVTNSKLEEVFNYFKNLKDGLVDASEYARETYENLEWGYAFLMDFIDVKKLVLFMLAWIGIYWSYAATEEPDSIPPSSVASCAHRHRLQHHRQVQELGKPWKC